MMRLIPVSVLVFIPVHCYTKALAKDKMNCFNRNLISLKQGPEKS